MRILLLALTAVSVLPAQHADTSAAPASATILKDLLAGNQRYVAGKPSRPHQTLDRRNELAKVQKPIAIVLSCSDSRVPPEVVFDQGLGDLFVVRVAGNIASDEGIASMEYAVSHLGPKLIVVLGHERCGAVDATLKGGPPEGHLAALVNAIKPAVDSTKYEKGDRLDASVSANVRNVVKQLKTTGPILNAKDLMIVGARYDLDSGKIDLVQ